MREFKVIVLLLAAISFVGCQSSRPKGSGDKELENLVKRSYQYVAMYNVINNFAMADENPLSTHGWNRTHFGITLADHTVKAIARPNNDTFYILSLLDVRDDAIVIHYPAIDTKYASLEVSAYDHYVTIPISTTKGGFKKPTTILYYSQRSGNYHGEPVEDVDKILEVTGDFVIAFLRLAPHVNDPTRAARIKKALDNLKLTTLSEFQGKPAVKVSPINFPAWGNDQKVFKNNFLEVMQFVFNHTTFDSSDEMDRAVLSLFKPLGVEPGKMYAPEKAAGIDGERLAQTAARIAKESLARWNDPDGNPYLFDVFKPKGQMSLEAMVVQSAVGPIGLPATEAVYPGVGTNDGEPMNAMHDYVIRMPTENDLPPARAFWSVTLYDAKNGFFIPNDRKKYIVGENGGMQLNDQGGIEIHIAAEKPPGVPEDNWLPINRQNIDLDVIMRIYAPNVEKLKTWKAPKAEKL